MSASSEEEAREALRQEFIRRQNAGNAGDGYADEISVAGAVADAVSGLEAVVALAVVVVTDAVSEDSSSPLEQAATPKLSSVAAPTAINN